MYQMNLEVLLEELEEIDGVTEVQGSLLAVALRPGLG